MFYILEIPCPTCIRNLIEFLIFPALPSVFSKAVSSGNSLIVLVALQVEKSQGVLLILTGYSLNVVFTDDYFTFLIEAKVANETLSYRTANSFKNELLNVLI